MASSLLRRSALSKIRVRVRATFPFSSSPLPPPPPFLGFRPLPPPPQTLIPFRLFCSPSNPDSDGDHEDSLEDDVAFDDDDDISEAAPPADGSDGLIPSLDPGDVYRQLVATRTGSVKIRREEWEELKRVFLAFKKSPWSQDQSLALYIPSSFLPTAMERFRRFFQPRCPRHVLSHLLALGPSTAADRFLFPIFADFCLATFPDDLRQFQSLMESADMTLPHTWFPFARAMKRKIVYHCGPTNSGKTYNALQRFMEAEKGVYCSPLRLLAMEVFDKVNALGVYCSLLTGQEKKWLPFSKHTACTIEMASTDELYDVAVIDEIQMMSDSTRGYAWTRALLGLKADEIHLCGDPSVLKIVKNMCKDTGDELVMHHYGRFKPLVVEAKTLLGDMKSVRSGDCIVAFSRREIFEVKLAIEKTTKHKCCVIYGALPPETRRQQAYLFNEQGNEYDVLVASDAIGMGLNLNIRRVIFYTLSKYNGDKIVPVPSSQVKQIAGRAGRRGSVYPDGLVTTFVLDDLDYLIECLQQPFEEVKKVGLFPFFEQVELFAGQFPDVTFSELLDKFRDSCRLDSSYFLCKHDAVKKVANMLEKVKNLSLEDRFNFCFAPVNIRDPKAMFQLMKFATVYSQNRLVNFPSRRPKGSAKNDEELLALESMHQILSMYLWLSNHFKEDHFPFVEKAEAMAADIAALLGKSLAKANWQPESRSQGKPRDFEEEEVCYEESKPVTEEHSYERPMSIIKEFKAVQQELSNQKEGAKNLVA